MALSAMEKTRLLDDLLCLPKGTTRAPANNFWELKLNIATFMSLVWVLFGSQCDYYKSLRQIFKTLKLKEVYALKASFTAENCRRITWAILDDGRAFFDDVKTTIDFAGPDITFPQSYLIDILNNVRYAVPVERASFPDKWWCRECVKDDKIHGRTTGGTGGRDRATEQSPLPGTLHGGSVGGASRLPPYGQGAFGEAGPGGTHYGVQTYMEPFPKGGGGANGTGKQDGTMFVTIRSGRLWTHTWNDTTDNSTLLRCLTLRESGNRTCRHYRVLLCKRPTIFVLEQHDRKMHVPQMLLFTGGWPPRAQRHPRRVR
jgi:hypothetical protein